MKPMTRPILVFLLVPLLAACGVASGTLGPVPSSAVTPSPSAAPSDPDLTPAPSNSPTSPPPSAAPSGTPGTAPTPSPEGTTIVRAYFHLAGEPSSEGLVPYLFEVPKTKAVATAAVNALLAGSFVQRDGFASVSSAIPSGTELLGLTISDGIATVDLSSEFESGGGSASAITRLGQVVYTLTQFSTVRSVVFQVEGRTVTVFGSEGVVLDGPSTRADFEDLLPAIFVDRPAYGAALGNPARVTGSSNVFEATSRVTILDGAGRVLVDQMVMADCGSGCRGKLDDTIAYDVSAAQWGTLRVYAGSAKDGSPIHIRDYPVWLTPAR